MVGAEFEVAMACENLPVGVLPAGAPDPSSVVSRLLAAFLSGRRAETIKAYQANLEDFRAFIQASTLEQSPRGGSRFTKNSHKFFLTPLALLLG